MKYLLALALLGVGALAFHLYGRLQDSEKQLQLVQAEFDSLQRASGATRGTLVGLYLSTRADRQTFFRLRRLVDIKQHLIESLQKGHVLTITAYNAEYAQTDDTPFITASNSRVRPGIVAVSQDLFRKGWVFGRKVYIVGQGVYTIEDLLAKRKKNQLDIFMNSKENALRFGRKRLRVFLLGA